MKTMDDGKQLLQEQIQYYRLRSSEYDEWHLRLGRYDRGETHRDAWFSELDSVRMALNKSDPGGDILEIACGTGLWTAQLAGAATRLTAIDASPEVIEINRQRIQNDTVHYVVADIFNWLPPQRYDFIFFGFWLSHVPPNLFENFWTTVRKALAPHGKVFFVDSLATSNSTAKDHAKLSQSGIVERKLNDGSQHRVVKVFYNPNELEMKLSQLGWESEVCVTHEFFLHGTLSPK